MNYSAFLAENWSLVAIFVIILFLIIRLELRQGSKAVSSQEVTVFMNREHAVVLDVREPAAFKEAHILGSKNIQPDLSKKPDPWQKYKKKKIVLVCNNGQFSAQFANKLAKHLENEDIKILRSGIEGWKGANLPLVCDSD